MYATTTVLNLIREICTLENSANCLIFEKSRRNGISFDFPVIHGCLRIWSIEILCSSGTRIFLIRSLSSALTFFIYGTSFNRKSTVEIIRKFLYAFKNCAVIWSIERWACRDNNIQQDTQRPYITAFAIIFVENLRCNVVRCTKNLVFACLLELFFEIRIPFSAETEVSKF